MILTRSVTSYTFFFQYCIHLNTPLSYNYAEGYFYLKNLGYNPPIGLVGWLVVLSINVDLAIFQSYLDLEAGDNQSLKIQVARPGIESRSSCSATQQLNHSTTTAPHNPPIEKSVSSNK